MTENLTIALQITLVGMGLVFLAIGLLWGLLVLIVRFSSEGQPVVESSTAQDIDEEARKLAAAIAAAAALSQSKAAPESAFPLPATAIVSAWQAVMRSNQLKQRGPTR